LKATLRLCSARREGSPFLSRAVARAASRFLIPPERVLFVGGGPMAHVLARKFRLHPEYELDPIGYVGVAETAGAGAGPNSSLAYLGHLTMIDELCRREAVERVVILSPEVSSDELADLIRRLGGLDVRIAILPHVVDVLGSSVEVDDVEGITVLGMTPPNLTRSSRMLKRAMDLVVGSALLILLSPLMLGIALAVKLTSAGPVFHKQERIGRSGRRFRIYKFRTMVKDAELKGRELARQSAHPAWLLLDSDPRVTRVGRLLRHASLDELPQLWNVLHGEMSLVGPRPIVESEIAFYGDSIAQYFATKPGMTGLWQVSGRSNTSYARRVQLDVWYVNNWSIWYDVVILLKTIPVLFSREGAA